MGPDQERVAGTGGLRRRNGGELSIQFRDLDQLEELVGRLTGEREELLASAHR